jgi:hypothetical protein
MPANRDGMAAASKRNETVDPPIAGDRAAMDPWKEGVTEARCAHNKRFSTNPYINAFQVAQNSLRKYSKNNADKTATMSEFSLYDTRQHYEASAI